MNNLFLPVAAEIPFLLLWLGVLYRLDRRWEEKGNAKVIFIMVIAGGVSVLPAWASYYVNPLMLIGRYGEFAFNFAVVGIGEELVKFLTFIIMARVMKSIREPIDGVIQGMAVGIGFALVENVLYGLWYDPGLTVLRSFLVGFHGIAGALWGFAWGGAVYENTDDRNPQAYRLAFMAIIPVALFHGLYNWLAYIAGDFATAILFQFVFEMGLLVLAVKGFRWMRTRSPFHRFDYEDAEDALEVIRRGLQRMPGNKSLLRRRAIYLLAAGYYGDAADALRKCLKGGSVPEVEGLLAVAMMGEGNDEGVEMLHRVARGLPHRRRISFEKELRKLVRDPELGIRVDLVFTGPIGMLDRWEARREHLRQWNSPRVVYPRGARQRG